MMRLLAKPFLIGVVVILALILLLLLAFASANTSFFDQYFALLYAANVLIGLLFLLVIIALVFNLAMRLRQKYLAQD